MSLLLRAALLGLATGSRSTLGIAALAASADRVHPVLRGAVLLASAGELTGDKLPQTPSRTEAPGLAARVVLGAVSAALLARRGGSSAARIAVAATAGSAGAVVGTYAGARWRAVAADRFGRDLPGAIAEDLAAVTLARYATT